MKTKTVYLTLCCTLLLGPVQAMADITMGVFPRKPPAATFKAFSPLAKQLSAQLGEEVRLVVPKDFTEFWKGVAEKKFDIVHFNQYHYIKSHKEQGYKVIVANEEFGDKKLVGTLAVRKDSGINQVKDLRGKTILFGGDQMAMGSYIAPTAILKKAGLVEGKDYIVKFAKNPPSAVIGVYNKSSDAAGTGTVVMKIKAVTSKIEVNQVKLLGRSEPMTNLPWAVKHDMPADKAGKIQKVMTTLKSTEAGKAILKSAGVTDFYAVTDADYNDVRKITEFAIGEKY